MRKWWIRFKCKASKGKAKAGGRKDPTSGEALFTEETFKAFEECIKHTCDITDVLSADDLYEAVEPPLGSHNRLTIYKGNRGVELTLEKAHHALAHFANGGMRRKLADALGLAGIAIYNLRIRF